MNGHTVSYAGEHAVAFRVDGQGNLIAFAGRKCHEITVDGRKTVFADADMDEIGWAPVAAERRVEGGAVIQLQVSGTGTVRIPAAGLPASSRCLSKGRSPAAVGRAFLAAAKTALWSSRRRRNCAAAGCTECSRDPLAGCAVSLC